MGVEGFSADSALLYHRYLPTAIVNAEDVEGRPRDDRAEPPLKPRHFKTQDLKSVGYDEVDAVTGRRTLFGNNDVTIGFVVATAPISAVPQRVWRRAAVRAGRFGRHRDDLRGADGRRRRLRRAADLVHLPGAFRRRRCRLLVLEATGHIGPPKRYLSKAGQFLEHSPYCERDIRGPSEPLLVEETDVDVLVRHRAGLTRFTYANHPFDVVGWDGHLYPWAFNIRDFEPITGRVHQPPPVHQTFEGPNFVVCSFCPRKVDYHPLAVPVPYNHANVDSDELMFYVGGNYEARKGSGIGIGSMSLHPSGCTHGPQPGAVEASLGVDYFDETAVMVDTFRPLELGEAAEACEDPGYAWTWARRGPA